MELNLNLKRGLLRVPTSFRIPKAITKSHCDLNFLFLTFHLSVAQT